VEGVTGTGSGVGAAGVGVGAGVAVGAGAGVASGSLLRPQAAIVNANTNAASKIITFFFMFSAPLLLMGLYNLLFR